jgi:hypothetical protein
MQRILITFLLFCCGCGSPIGARQSDGSDCNYAEPETACVARSYCDPGESIPVRGYARTRNFGFFNDKSHVVGTCRPQGATGAACALPAACVSGRCTHAEARGPGVCE